MNRKTLLAVTAAIGTLAVIVVVDTLVGARHDRAWCCVALLSSARAIHAGPADRSVAPGGPRVEHAPLARYPSITISGARHLDPPELARDEELERSYDADSALRLTSP